MDEHRKMTVFPHASGLTRAYQPQPNCVETRTDTSQGKGKRVIECRNTEDGVHMVP